MIEYEEICIDNITLFLLEGEIESVVSESV